MKQSQREFVAMFRDRCKQHGLAYTHQRQVIYQALLCAKDHPTPEALYEKVRDKIPSISPATVYKNLKTFIDAGLLREVTLHHGSLRVDANLEVHHHIVCRSCRSIADIGEHEIEPVRFQGKLPEGFQVQRQCVEIIGLCASCAKQKSSN
jgi:Fur family transcriptional regulator, peroxide stress response regulator